MKRLEGPGMPGPTVRPHEHHGRHHAACSIGAPNGGLVHVILDVSRLLSCVHRLSPSGIDRVEMAYARHWLARPETDCTFTAQSPWGWFAALPRDRVAALLEALAETWEHGATAG